MPAKQILKTRIIVGMEIHVQLRTQTKMFCGCKLSFDAAPNSYVCPVCLGHPGSLPVINKLALRFAMLAGLAMNCKIASYTKWDRKNYFYPDLPKNYQVSQYDLPICGEGYFDLPSDTPPQRIRIRRAHLEEDAGKNIHDSGNHTQVDLNRAGTPLLEIVTEPDIHSAQDAYAFCTELHRLVTYIGISDANMQMGQMRFEPNVNVEITHSEGVSKTPIAEIKNLNSFRAVKNAIEYEAQRQIAAWEEDSEYVIGKANNENRGWNDDRGMTEFQRTKEAAQDYRYLPDPDLVPVTISETMINEIRAELPELPLPRRLRFINKLTLSPKDAGTILDQRTTADFFEEAIKAGGPTDVLCKQIINIWLGLAGDRQSDISNLSVSAAKVAELASITDRGDINKSAAKQIAEAMLTDEKSPSELAKQLGLIQVKDTAATQAWVQEAIDNNAQAVQDTIGNPKKAKAAMGFLRGQVMRISAGQADPKLVGELIEKLLMPKSE